LLFSHLLSLLGRNLLRYSHGGNFFFNFLFFSDGGCDHEQIIELQHLSHWAIFVINLSQVIALIRKVFQEEAVGNDLILVLLLILHVGWNIVAKELELIKFIVQKFEAIRFIG